MKDTLLTYRIAILWGVLFILDTIFTAIWGALQNVVWANLDAQAKFLLLLFVGKQSFSTIMAYLSTASKLISEGKSPLSNKTSFFASDPKAAPPETKP